MASMSYCVFENTVVDLRNCLSFLEEALNSGQTFDEFIDSRSSEYEMKAVSQLIQLCEEITEMAKAFDDQD